MPASKGGNHEVKSQPERPCEGSGSTIEKFPFWIRGGYGLHFTPDGSHFRITGFGGDVAGGFAVAKRPAAGALLHRRTRGGAFALRHWHNRIDHGISARVAEGAEAFGHKFAGAVSAQATIRGAG
jgi:hypothetical protein